MKVLACIEYDTQASSCTVQAWVEQPSLIPAMTAADGIYVSGLFIAVAASAWGFRFLARYLSPKT